MILAETIGIIFFFTAKYLVGLFNATPEIMELGQTHARITSLFFCLLAFSHAIAAVCRGAGKAVVPMAIMLAIWCVLRVTYIMLVMHFIQKIELIYWAYPITWTISSIIYFFYYKFSKWEKAFGNDKPENPFENQEKLSLETTEISQKNENEDDVFDGEILTKNEVEKIIENQVEDKIESLE